MDHECQVFHLPKGACQIQRVLFSSNFLSSGVVVQAKIPKLQEGFRLVDRPIAASGSQSIGVKTLLNTCIDFVSYHAEHLESLEGFPFQIGEIIWDKLLNRGKLDRANRERVQILESFVDGYPSEMLKSCHINSLVLLNNFEEEIKILIRYCTSLSLSNCKLDENHDLLVELPKNCQQLTHLDLSKNKLSSASLRLTFGVPGQVGKKVFPLLKYLNVSGNAKKHVSRPHQIWNMQKHSF